MPKYPKSCFDCVVKPALRGKTKRQRKKIIDDLTKVECSQHTWTINKELAMTQALCDDKVNAELPKL